MSSADGFNSYSDSSARPQNWLVTHVSSDVWRTIFNIYIAEDIPAHLIQNCPRTILLCQICSHWRQIVIETPELWTEISVFIRRTGQPSPHPELLNLFLHRAGGIPLKISLRQSLYAFPEALPSTTRDVIRILLRNFRRADDVEINTDLFTFLPHFFEESSLEDILPAGAPLLRNLIFRMGNTMSAIDARLSRIWILAPNLRRVVFDEDIFDEQTGFKYLHAADTLQIPFGQLTSININSPIPAHDLYDLLYSSKNLVEGIIGFLQWRHYDLPPKPILIPTLEHLHIDAGNSLPLLGCLQMPALTTLILGDTGKSWSNDDFASFLENSSASIQHFGFSVCYDDSAPEEKMETLRLLPQLKHLTLSSCKESSEGDGGFNKTLILELGKWDESLKEFLLLPRLQKITIDYAALPHPNRSTLFADMVEDRQIAVKVTNVEEDLDRGKDGRSWVRWSPLEIVRLLVLKKGGFSVELDPSPSIETEAFYHRRRVLL